MLNESNIPLEEDGIEEEILVDEEVAITKAMWGDVGGNIENQTDLQNALDAKQDSLTEAQLNAVNSGITAEKVTTYDGYADQIASKADQSALNAESTARGEADTALGTRIDNEALARQSADNGLQSQIDAITSKSDVVDVVANYAALQAYDTSTLGNNDVVKVLDDETHEDALTYYRWSTTTQTWSYIGQEAPYYSKGQMDVKLAEKQDKLTAGANIQIQNGTISATDTTYTAGNGLNLNGTEFNADTDVLATKEDLDNYYTKPETDNLLAPKLEAEVVTELPTTGTEGKLYLTPKAHTSQTATGNPITATVAEEAGKIESFQLDGDTLQNGTPTPEEPVPIQTVTGTQVISITKNVITDDVAIENARLNSGGNINLNVSNRLCTTSYVPVEPNTTYYFSVNPEDSSKTLQAYFVGYTFQDDVGIGAYPSGPNWANLPFRITTGENCHYVRVGLRFSDDSDMTPSSVQDMLLTRPGEYTVSLGNLELWEVDNAKDYIFNSGDSWYVHRAISRKEPTGVESYNFFEGMARFSVSEVKTGANARIASTHFEWEYANAPNKCYVSTSSLIAMGIPNITTEAEAKSWVAANKPVFYCPLLNPINTLITDTALITQLEAIRTAMLQNGANTITNTATGTNLAGDMEIGYYGYNPTNRYDKWLWLDINNEYEQIGS